MVAINQQLQKLSNNLKTEEIDATEIFNMSFKKGQRVRDKITDKGGVIIGGKRTTYTISPARSG
jgi:hypothetical protein